MQTTVAQIINREDISLQIAKPDWAYHMDNEKMVEVILKRDAAPLIQAVTDGQYEDVIETFYVETDDMLSAFLRKERVGFTLTNVTETSCRLQLHVVPTPEGDDILDGSHRQEDLTLTDMMKVVSGVKTFMKLLG